MRRVVLESPYAGYVEINVGYLKLALADSLKRGEAPIASHRMYPGILDDDVPEERERGMAAGHAWIAQAEAMVVYCDFGLSKGMRRAIDIANAAGIPVEMRYIVQPEGFAGDPIEPVP